MFSQNFQFWYIIGPMSANGLRNRISLHCSYYRTKKNYKHCHKYKKMRNREEKIKKRVKNELHN
jgi:hypothetical protein